mmetsp:Transcript_24985/g.99277  ORF Transcript_24985/g.99277 Transcript_24985/m.99277 type:complete len:282 (-) Transcript_24985:3286-4131(-)
MLALLLSPLLLVVAGCVVTSEALVLSGVDVRNAKVSPISRALDDFPRPDAFPYAAADLQPLDPLDDGVFYFWPKLAHHAGAEARAELQEYYRCALRAACADGGDPDPKISCLDLCSSFTSHYPRVYPSDGQLNDVVLDRVAVLGLNAAELLLNPSKTEWRVQNLNTNPKLPYGDAEFDVITNSLSVDYLTRPLDVFDEMHRVLKPGGLAAMAFTNRCFPTKVVPIWTRPFSEEHHARIVANYFRFSGGPAGWDDISVADVSPSGWAGLRDPMVVVAARKSS